MGMRKAYIYTPLFIAGMLAFGLFTGGPDVPMDSAGSIRDSLEDNLDTVDASFGGEAVSIKGGITVQVSKLKSFTPQEADLFTEGDRGQLFDITITNNGKKPLDLFLLAIVKTDISGKKQAVCLDVFQEEGGLQGVPFEPVKVGETVSFPWGMSCPGAKGTDIEVTIAITDKEQVKFVGVLA